MSDQSADAVLEPQKNEPTSPEQWVDLYGDDLFRFALSRLRNYDEAENAVQETFLAALKAKENFSGQSTEKTWLIGILKHKIIDYFRKTAKETVATDLNQNEQAVNDFFDTEHHMNKRPSDWLPEPQALAENKEFWKVLHLCMDKLPKSLAAVFRLKELEQLGSKEVCQSLNISPSNLWVILHRCRLQLRQCLEANWFKKDL